MKKNYKNYYVHGERNRTMEKIELTEEQIDYIRLYIEDEIDYNIVGLSNTIRDAIEAYNGGAR